MWKNFGMNCWYFDGLHINFNPPLFPIIILDPSVSLKGFMSFQLTWLNFCPTNILMYDGVVGMRYLNMLLFGNILLMLISLPLL